MFDGMHGKRDVVVWNAMISGCTINGLYLEMLENVLSLDSSMIVAILTGVAEGNKLYKGTVHGYSI